MKKETVIVGLSGGVDSGVTALRLVEAGYDVRGVFMQNWEASPGDPHCTAEQDLTDAKAVADTLNIPFEVVNFSKQYWNRVFQLCLDEFHAGRTPNPDIWCNKEIKFNCFLDYALQQGADKIATGHYAGIQEVDGTYHLMRAEDNHKDQTYFLYTLGQHALSHALFPLFDIEKSNVRKLAENNHLPNFDKKDSTGICFIGERDFKTFLQEFILAQPGDIKTDDGKIVGKHDGLMFYTLGQRKGLHIGGLSEYSEDAWYVVDKDIPNNTLIIGQGHNHPLLFKSELTCEAIHWVSGNPPTLPLTCRAKTRYNQQDQTCVIQAADNNKLRVAFDEPQRAVTPGQSVVFYSETECLGGGIIC